MLHTLRDWQKPAIIYDVIQESIVSPSVNNTNCRHSDPTQEELTSRANPNLLSDSRHQIMPRTGWQTLLIKNGAYYIVIVYSYILHWVKIL